MEKYLPYGFLLAIVITLVLFAIPQIQRRQDKAERAAEPQGLPKATTEKIESLLGEVKSRLPSKTSGLMLIEFEDGQIDIAVGFSSAPLFVYSRHQNLEVVKVIDMASGETRSYLEISADTDFGALSVYDADGQPITGNFEAVAFEDFKYSEHLSPFVIGESLEEKEKCKVQPFGAKEDGNFSISVDNAPNTSTKPIFLDDNTVLGFVTVMTPSKYKTEVKKVLVDPKTETYEMRTERRLIEWGKLIGIFASKIYDGKTLRLDTEKFSKTKSINSKRNK